jgi:hypothetical protein
MAGGKYTGRLHVWETQGPKTPFRLISSRNTGGDAAVFDVLTVITASDRFHPQKPEAAMPPTHAAPHTSSLSPKMPEFAAFS